MDTCYISVFISVVVINAAVMALIGVHVKFTSFNTSLVATTNLLIGVACRNEYMVNLLFTIFVDKSVGLPLPTRRVFAKIYCCHGGIHSACAVSALIWYMVFVITMMQANKSNIIVSDPLANISYLSLALLLLIVFFASPQIRDLHHNYFECVHRYSAWSLLVLLWIQLVLSAVKHTAQSPTKNITILILCDARIWEAAIITGLVLFPWLHLRKRKIEAVKLSSHALVLNFDFQNVSFGQAIRITDSPLRETHAFAVVPNVKNDADDLSEEERTFWRAGQKGFSIIISRAGDWTSRIIDSPPSHIWTRGIPQYGLLRVVNLFRPCIIIATGSGIGPCLSVLVQRPTHPVKIIWSTRSPIKTYGSAVVETILRVDPTAIIHDTDELGRPNLISMASNVWEAGSFEAVVLISNKKVTQMVISGLEEKNICSYGVIFDS